MLRTLGKEEKAEKTLALMRESQLESSLLPAADSDHHFTGLYLSDGLPWEYAHEGPIAPTAWMLLALNDFNPYRF